MRHIRVQHLFSSTHGAPDQIRRSLDVVIACALLAITAPLMLLVALAVKVESPGPVLVLPTPPVSYLAQYNATSSISPVARLRHPSFPGKRRA